MHWHCEDNGHICSSYLPESFVMRCFGIVRTIPTSSSSWSTDQTFDLGLRLSLLQRMSSLFDNFDHRVRTTLSLSDFGLHCGSAITVVERLQRYNCIWLTYIENVEQNVLPQCRRFEAVRCYLCVESWFGDGTLCSNYVLYSEEGCTDTFSESLRSWEVNAYLSVIH